MDKRNKQGQTLEEFLQGYDAGAYPRPAVTADAVVFSVTDGKAAALLVKRADHPDIGEWALPGGFVGEYETCGEAAERELKEETGLEDFNAEQLVTVSALGRDPRGRVITVCYFAVVRHAPLKPGDDAAEAAWFTIDYAANDDEYVLVLKNAELDLTLTSRMKIVRRLSGTIDIDRSAVVENDGLAFDHAKIILYAIEKL
jgi:ADP-ribose pyrophosphatase YjhB (NUDIX family)